MASREKSRILPPLIARRTYLYTYEEIYSKIVNRIRKRKKLSQLKKMEIVYNILYDNYFRSLNVIRQLLTESDEFYLELFRIGFGDDLWSCYKKLHSRLRLLREIMSTYKLLVLESGDSYKYCREAIGRMLSLFKRSRKCITLLKEFLITVSKMPSIDASLPTLIVSGIPNAGKSTFVKTISSADPEVAPYPFTTQEIIVGHVMLGVHKLQVIDTPGIIERPDEKRNPIERRALAALMKITGGIIFLVDPTDTAYQDLWHQYKLLQELDNRCKKKVLVVINKIDITPTQRVNEAVRLFCSKYPCESMCAHDRESAMNVVKKAFSLSYGLPEDLNT